MTKKFFAILTSTVLVICMIFSTSAIETSSDAMQVVDESLLLCKDLETDTITTIEVDEELAFEYYDIPTVQSVIGDDDREQIDDTTDYPYSAIAFIEIDWPNSTSTRGTAWFVSDNVLVTAGHCLYNDEKGGWAEYVTVKPGKDGLGFWNNLYGSADAIKFYAPAGYTENNNIDYDYGMIVIDKNLGAETGAIKFAIPTNEELSDLAIEICGYASIYEVFQKYRQYSATGTIYSYTDNLLYYTVDTSGGQSGSPILTEDNIAIGIHTRGSTSFNIGKRLTSGLYASINKIISEHA